MRFNHLDLAVRDVPAVAKFLQDHFGLSCVAERPGFALLTDGHGFALVLSALAPDEPDGYPPGFHVGFNVSTEHEVRQCHERLAVAGAAIVRAPAMLAGALTFQCVAPGGVVVEVGCRSA